MQNRKAVLFDKEIEIQNRLFYLCPLKDALAYYLAVSQDKYINKPPTYSLNALFSLLYFLCVK